MKILVLTLVREHGRPLSKSSDGLQLHKKPNLHSRHRQLWDIRSLTVISLKNFVKISWNYRFQPNLRQCTC